jgi:tetratricopeptide (TPR) repeat protein
MLLDHAEAVMEEHPDSAYQFLCEADSCVADQSRKTRMRHQMLMTEAKNKLDMPLPSDTLFQEVVDYYDGHGNPNQQLMAHYLLGRIYSDRGEAPQALQCYNDAVEKADTLSDDCDYTTLYKVYGQMADVFEAQVMPNEEIEALKRYSQYALKAGNTYEYIRGIEFMAGAYDLKGDTAMILATEEKAHNLYKMYNMPKAAASAYTTSMYVYIAKRNYQKAHQLMQLFEKESGLFDEDGNTVKGREGYYYCKGLYYMGVNHVDSAELYFKKLLNNPKHSFYANRGLMRVSQKKGDASAVHAYSKDYEASFDTLITNIHAQATRQAEGMYDYTRHQRIAEAKQHEAERNRLLLILVVTIFLFISCAAYILYRNYRNRQLREIARLNNLYVTTQLHHDQLQAEMQGLQNNYSETLTEKEKELETLKQQLQLYQQQYDRITPSDKEMSLMQSDIVHAFRKMLKPPYSKDVPSRSDWKHLLTLVRQCLPTFYHQIMEASDLTMPEKQVCILTRLSFLPNDIVILLHSTSQRISNAKANANKKLFSDDSAKHLFSNLKHWC